MPLDPETNIDFRPASAATDTHGLLPRFYRRAVQNNARTALEGRPIFEDRDYIEILIPGDKRTVIDRAVKDEDRLRWPQAWAAFQAGLEAVADGTMLESWPQLTAAQVAELKALNFRTVEQLAEAGDAVMQKFMGGFAMRDKARLFLQQARDASAASRWAAEKEALQTQVDALKAQISELAASAHRSRAPEPVHV